MSSDLTTSAVSAGGAGPVNVLSVDAAQRQIVCSLCMHVNLPMALPQLWCSGCNKQIRSGTHYYKESGERLNIKLCKECGCLDNAEWKLNLP